MFCGLPRLAGRLRAGWMGHHANGDAIARFIQVTTNTAERSSFANRPNGSSRRRIQRARKRSGLHPRRQRRNLSSTDRFRRRHDPIRELGFGRRRTSISEIFIRNAAHRSFAAHSDSSRLFLYRKRENPPRSPALHLPSITIFTSPSHNF